MATPAYVPDASVILKWALRGADERDSEKAFMLLDRWLAGDCSLLLPGLWIYECGNVLGLKAPATAAEIMEILLGYHFDECPISATIAGTALRIMRDCRVTFYDAVYHAVAFHGSATFITADAAYWRKAGKLGQVVLLEEFK